MPTIRGVTNLLAGIANNNVLSGSAYEFLQFPARIDVAVVGDAAGTARATVQSGSDVLLEESPISRANRVPVWPDDYDLSDVGAPPDRLKIAIRNTGGVAIDVFWSIRITPLQ